jgi:hypothetical protein
LTLKCDEPPSTSAFKFSLRHYTLDKFDVPEELQAIWQGLQASIYLLNLSRFVTETTQRTDPKVLRLSQKVDECKPLPSGARSAAPPMGRSPKPLNRVSIYQPPPPLPATQLKKRGLKALWMTWRAVQVHSSPGDPQHFEPSTVIASHVIRCCTAQ